jgi:hypothetical protein
MFDMGDQYKLLLEVYLDLNREDNFLLSNLFISSKVQVAFRISSFKMYLTCNFTGVCNFLRHNKVMGGYFHLLRNLFTLSCGHTYKYDPHQPLLNHEKMCVIVST